MTGTVPALKLVVAVESLRAGPVTFALEADAADREALAAAYGLVALRHLVARGEIDRTGKLITVRGHLEADLDQACVVTLEPVAAKLREEIAVDLLESGAPPPPVHEDADPPDILEGDTIDVGALVEEHFVLGLDPYPRLPDAELPVEYASDGDGNDSPFAALSGLASAGDGDEEPGNSKD